MDATSGGWVESNGAWSNYGILGSAFDGEKIVMSSAESKFGSLGCNLFLRGDLINGICYENFPMIASPTQPPTQICAWELTISKISKSLIQGFRTLKSSESDPGCKENYPSRPTAFTFTQTLKPLMRTLIRVLPNLRRC